MPTVRKLSKFVPLTREQFRARFYDRFQDPAFDAVQAELEKVCEVAWDGYIQYRKAPRTKDAGADFANPQAKLPVEWLAAREAILEAQKRHDNPASPARVLLVDGATRSEHTCPGEVSKTQRLVQRAADAITAQPGFEVDVLHLHALADEPWKVIHPCKTCVSTAMPLCHWPCSCYPNHAMGQTNDWMNDIYPRWVAAHGVLVATPVNWYQASSSLKLMIDRLVCADGGNPDPTSTAGKDPAKAKALELKGWDYPRHLAGRAYAVIVHGDAEGAESVRRALSDWLREMGLLEAGGMSQLARYIGYYQPYATSHDALDADDALFREVDNVARSLAEKVRQLRAARCPAPDAGLADPRPK